MTVATLVFALLPSGMLLAPSLPHAHGRAAATPRSPATVCVAADFTGSGPAESERPVELQGPWELRSTLSGCEALWVELGDDGTVGCSSKVGVGKTWSAERRGASWQLRVTLLAGLWRATIGRARAHTHTLM